MLSQCSMTANSCSKGNSLLTAHGILQPRVALEGRASSACMGDGVQGLRLQSGPLRRWGEAKNLSRPPDTGRKSRKKAEAAEDKSPPAQKYAHQPSLQAKPRSLDPPAPSPRCSSIREQHGKAAAPEHTHSLEGSRTTPLFHPFPACSQRGTAQQGGAASPLLQSHAQPHWRTNCFIKCHRIKPVS